YLIALFLAILIAASSIVVPHITRQIVDEFITHENALVNITQHRERLIYLIGFVIFFTLFRTSVAFVTMMMFEKTSQSVLYNLRLSLYDNLQRQDKEFFSKNTSGDLMSTLTSDLDMIRHSIAWLIKTMIESLTVFLSAILYLSTINMQLTLWMGILAPIIFILTNRLSKEVRPLYRKLRNTFANLNSAAQENIAANRTIKAFSTQDYEIEKFNKISKEFQMANEEVSFTWIKYNPTLEFLSHSFSIILLLVGGLYIMQGKVSFGEFAAYSSLIWAISNPMKNIGILINDIQRISVSVEKIQSLENATSKITKTEYIENPFRLEGIIEFKDVGFAHEDVSQPVLKNINFKVGAKDRVALIGPTGSGKTTLINLLMRQYNPTIGTVLVDNKDIRSYPLDAYQANIAITTQSAVLFSDSIKNNIGYGMKDYDEKRILDAAFAAFAHEFIEDTEGGYETVIGEDGVGLSGGQQQRLALARAFASNRPILILDDTTSALDNRTEKLILKSLDFMRHQSTQFLITQRVSTASAADLILVLDNGELIEKGTHNDLMNLKGYYYKMHQIQNTETKGGDHE
ncbi:MAG TPA: ABC transporter ATP-binding protein, partial [Erysipelothrix sp.]|nr:ABC transporter ATP-binding protein [Erysipelothrix sp.]